MDGKNKRPSGAPGGTGTQGVWPYQAPASATEPDEFKEFGTRPGVRGVFGDTWRLFSARFAEIFIVFLVLWLPLNFFIEFVSYDLPPDPLTILLYGGLELFLDSVVGIIGLTAFFEIARMGWNHESLPPGEAAALGVRKWWKMWVTTVLYFLVLLAGFVFLVLPGIYLATRLYFVHVVVIEEGKWGPGAFQRSWEISRGRFWRIFGYMTAIFFALAIPFLGISALTAIPVLDHWAIFATTVSLLDLGIVFSLVLEYVLFRRMAQPPGAQREQAS